MPIQRNGFEKEKRKTARSERFKRQSYVCSKTNSSSRRKKGKGEEVLVSTYSNRGSDNRYQERKKIKEKCAWAPPNLIKPNAGEKKTKKKPPTFHLNSFTQLAVSVY